MTRRSDLVAFLITFACACVLLLHGYLEILALHIAAASVLLLTESVYVAINLGRWRYKPLEVAVIALFLISFVSGFPIIKHVNTAVTVIHLVSSFAFVLAYLALFSTKLFFKERE